MSTDSESEAEIQSQKKAVPMQQFKWTPENEEILEEVLVKNLFDFQATTREFTKIINSGEVKDQNGEPIYYKIDAKSLQLRWTDIEIRKYRLKQGKAEEQKSPERNAASARTAIDEEEDDLPPLEEKPATPTKASEEAAASGSDSDGESKVAYYTNLEELD